MYHELINALAELLRAMVAEPPDVFQHDHGRTFACERDKHRVLLASHVVMYQVPKQLPTFVLSLNRGSYTFLIDCQAQLLADCTCSQHAQHARLSDSASRFTDSIYSGSVHIASVFDAQVGVRAAALCVGLAASTTSICAFQGSQHPDHRHWPRLPEPACQATGQRMPHMHLMAV